MELNLKLKRIIFEGKKALLTHGPTICTVAGCVGVAATGVLAWTGRAKCDEIMAEMEDDAPLGTILKATWKGWVPPVAVGVLSIGAIILSNGLSRKQISALIATNACNAAALCRTSESIKERMDAINETSKLNNEEDVLALPDGERRELIFENDCDNDVICLNPDGVVYWDDWTNIYFRQLPSVVENGYFQFNRLYTKNRSINLYKLYELWGFNDSIWSQAGISHKFKSIGFEQFVKFDDECIFDGNEMFIDFREICGKKAIMFGGDDTIPLEDRKKYVTRITYLFAPHVLYSAYRFDMEYLRNSIERFDTKYFTKDV